MKQFSGIALWFNGQIVLQRRDNKAPTDPNTLGFFGGHLEGDEWPEDGARRELDEETSLDVDALDLEPLFQENVPTSGLNPAEAIAHMYKAKINSLDFKVYEGAGAEAYKIEEALGREDLCIPTRQILERIVKEDLWH